MIRVNGKKSGFTLIEMLVVVAMIAVILGAITTSVSAAQGRARIQKAKSDVKIISQAILAYEKISSTGDIPTMDKAEAGSDTLGFLLGSGGTTTSGEAVPVLISAAIRSGGKIRDPWGHPYIVNVKKASAQVKLSVASGSMESGCYLPNFYRLKAGERVLWSD